MADYTPEQLAEFDPNPEERARLNAALGVLDPDIRGAKDLIAGSISPPLRAVIQSRVQFLTNRRNLVQAKLDTLDQVVMDSVALADDGYPVLENVPLSAALLAELKGQVSDTEAAAGMFGPDQRAAGGTIAMGRASDNPPE